MKTTVELDDRSYDVLTSDGARHELSELLNVRAPRAQSVAIVTSQALAAQPWFDVVSGRRQSVLFVPEGESAKTLTAAEALLESLADLKLSRDDVVVGVGGGAVTDLAGFAAAVYLRGVGLVQIPTSLVGQVDAAIGGKTGVNLSAGKNLVGAFYQPLGVLCDSSVLETLPERERLSGLGEIAKCWLLERRDANGLAETSLSDLAAMAIRLKVSLVSSDEREGGQRVLLNYGHTLAHALEKLSLARDADALRHGEAVAVGLAFAVRLAHELGRVDVGVIANHDAVLRQLGLDKHLPKAMDTEELLEAMQHDKKSRHDFSFVLPDAHGFALVSGIDPTTVRTVLDRFRGEL